MPHSPKQGSDTIRSFQMPARFWMQRAEQSERQGNLPRAAALLRHALQQGGDAAAGVKYAWLLRRLQCVESSCRECLWLLARWPGLFGVYGLLALNLMDMGKKQEAVDACTIYSQYEQMYPHAELPWDEEVYVLEETMTLVPAEERRCARSRTLLDRAWQAADRGDASKAKALHEKLLSQNARPVETMCLGAMITNDREFSLLAARNAASLSRGNVPLLLHCAKAASRFSRREAGRILLKTACLVRNPEDLSKLCSMCRALDMEWIAQGELRAANRESPTRLDVLFQQCVFALHRGDDQEACRIGRRLELLDPEDPSVAKLCRLLRRIGTISPKERSSQPFYYEPDTSLDKECLHWAKERLSDPCALLKSHADQVRWQHLLRGGLLSAQGMELLRSLRKAPDEIVAPLIGSFLLGQPKSLEMRRAARMLVSLRKPPYMAHCRSRLQLLRPELLTSRPVSLYERKQKSVLLKIKHHLGMEYLPIALRVMNLLPRKHRMLLATNHNEAWLPAFAAELCRMQRQPLPILHFYMLWPARFKEWKQARKIIRRVIEKRKLSLPQKGESQ